MRKIDIARLHELMDACMVRDLNHFEQKEYDRLAEIWSEEDLQRMRRLNASANLPEEYDPWVK